MITEPEVLKLVRSHYTGVMPAKMQHRFPDVKRVAKECARMVELGDMAGAIAYADSQREDREVRIPSHMIQFANAKDLAQAEQRRDEDLRKGKHVVELESQLQAATAYATLLEKENANLKKALTRLAPSDDAGRIDQIEILEEQLKTYRELLARKNQRIRELQQLYIEEAIDDAVDVQRSGPINGPKDPGSEPERPQHNPFGDRKLLPQPTSGMPGSASIGAGRRDGRGGPVREGQPDEAADVG